MKIKSHFDVTVKRPVAIIMIVLGIAVFGYVSYKRLSWDLMPKISYPSYTIRTEYPGAAPEEVENVVSRPLEEQLSLIKDLVSLTSVSRPEQSDIVLEFTWDANLDRSSQEIREKLDQVQLDEGVEKPMILRYDPSLDPVLRLAIVSDIPLLDLRLIAEDEIARELEALPGVAAARVKGGFEKEIFIKLDEKQLAATQIRFNDITARLAQENINLAGGNVKEGETEYIVRTLNEFRNIQEIGDIIIARKEGVLIRLKDIAEIAYSHKERQVITRVNQKESIEIDIYKEADANIVDVSNRVKERLLGTAEQQRFVEMMKTGQVKDPAADPLLEKSMTDFLAYRLGSQGQKMEYNILADQAIFIESSINEVRDTAVLGGILAILILYLFLQNFSTTLIVAVSIPLSVIATFAPLDLFKVSLNIMSLGGLAMGIGMLVDNSIVVMESIFRCREEGDEWVESAVRGVSEVGNAVVASTLTTVAVFFPIVFVEGIAGQIFGDLSLAVVFSLLASLMVSLYFIPMLASRKAGQKKELPVKKFSYTFEKERTLKNFLRVPLQLIFNSARICGHLVAVSAIFCLAGLGIMLYPLLTLLRLKQPLIRLTGFLTGRFNKEKLLWEEYMTLTPFDRFIQSLAKRQGWVKRALISVYFYCRFFSEALAFIFTRILLSFLGLGVVLFKGLGIVLLASIMPVIKVANFLFGKLLSFINTFYPRLLVASINKSNQVIAVTLVIFAITILVILPRLGSELIPEVHQGTLHVNINFPVGTPVEKNDEVLQKISRQIGQLDRVERIGYFAGTTRDELTENEVGEHIGKVTVTLKKSRNIQAAEESVIANIRTILSGFTDLDFHISRPVLFTMKPPIEVLIKGYNLEQLRRISAELHGKIAALPGLKDVQSSVKAGFPELVVEFERMRLSRYGLNAFDVASLIKNKIEGFVATQYKEKDKRVGIRVYLKDEQRERAENIKNLIVNPGGAIPIPLNSVANVVIESGPNEIRRVNQERCAIISANIAGISLTSATKEIYDTVKGYPLPAGFTYELSGQDKEMKVSLDSLALAMLLAIFLVYIVMAAQFESFLHPFLILFTIPMALIGVFPILFILGIPIGVTVYIGLITLVGIVVNNAILLIDYINTLRKRGLEKIEAIKLAGSVRMRPILMTTTTTVLGLLPMAIGLGEGTEIRTPMAITVIAGLVSSTFLTLVLIPIIYNKYSK